MRKTNITPKRVVRSKIDESNRPRRVTIQTSDDKVDVWDTIVSTTIDSKLLVKSFTIEYDAFKQELIKIATSRLALESVITDLDKALTDNANAALQIGTNKLSETFDSIYESAIVAYATSRAYSFLTEEALQGLLSKGIEMVKTKSGPIGVGATRSHTPPSAASVLKEVEEHFGGKLGETPLYGETKEKETNPVGVSRTKSR